MGKGKRIALLIDVDNVKIDVYNSDGKLVKSVNTTFTMGDMTNPI